MKTVLVLFVALFFVASNTWGGEKIDTKAQEVFNLERSVFHIKSLQIVPSREVLVVPTLSLSPTRPLSFRKEGKTNLNQVTLFEEGENSLPLSESLEPQIKLVAPTPDPFRNLLYYDHYDDIRNRGVGYDAFGRSWRLSPRKEFIFPLFRWRYPTVRGEDIAICVGWTRKF